jgi:Protein of unknown function (DUF2721)
LTENPFAALTAIAAPAILTNACSVLALGTSNRVARVVDRTRIVVAELKHLEAGSAPHSEILRQIARLGTRADLLVRALRSVYAGLGGFASSALLAAVGGVASFYDQPLLSKAAAIVGLLVGVSAVGGLVTGCVLMVTETRLALLSVREQVQGVFVRQRQGDLAQRIP